MYSLLASFVPNGDVCYNKDAEFQHSTAGKGIDVGLGDGRLLVWVSHGRSVLGPPSLNVLRDELSNQRVDRLSAARVCLSRWGSARCARGGRRRGVRGTPASCSSCRSCAQLAVPVPWVRLLAPGETPSQPQRSKLRMHSPTTRNCGST